MQACALSRSSSDVINYVLSALRNVAMAQKTGRREKCRAKPSE
jgi:hypothetical protein